MKIINDKVTFYINKNKNITEDSILFIHGFTGSSSTWKQTMKNINSSSLSIDMPGHGESKFNKLNVEYTYNDWSNDLYLILNQLNINKINICGYSMGGRLALHFSIKYPHMVNKLILENTTLGIEEYDLRKEKYEQDVELSKTIEFSKNKFFTTWQDNPLFIKQEARNKEEYLIQKKIRNNQDKYQLAKALRSFSVGNIKFLLQDFQNLNFPIYSINGSEDNKYIKEGRVMLRVNIKAEQYIINNASHNTHLENPIDFISTINTII